MEPKSQNPFSDSSHIPQQKRKTSAGMKDKKLLELDFWSSMTRRSSPSPETAYTAGDRRETKRRSEGNEVGEENS